MMEDHFPKKVLYKAKTSESGKPASFKVQTSPIWDANSNLDKILFVVEDVTDVENLERAVKAQNEKFELLQEIFSGGIPEAFRYFDGLRTSVSLLQSSLHDVLDIGYVARELHTLKGNARLCKLKTISKLIHEQENELSLLQQQPSTQTADYVNWLTMCINAIENEAAIYSEFLGQLQPLDSRNGIIPVQQSSFDAFRIAVQKMRAELDSTQQRKLQDTVDLLMSSSIRLMVSRFEAMTIDIGAQLGKKIQFEVEGDGLLNKDRMEALQIGLLHLIRNACDHGIESREALLSSGKRDIGTIRISCVEKSDMIVVQLSDHGAGIDVRKIRESAVAKGLISRDEMAKMSDTEALDLIFRPGFSTKDFATNVSGRGVGAEVAKAKVAELGGILTIRTELGRGTDFTLSFPKSAPPSNSEAIRSAS